VIIDYQEYLQTEGWKARATYCKARAGWRCQICNKSGGERDLHAHHRTYERLGDEWPDDLTCLCESCHERFHGVRAGRSSSDITEALKRRKTNERTETRKRSKTGGSNEKE
jgi:5-methylcytosine-specific restriction endonuclease McrA